MKLTEALATLPPRLAGLAAAQRGTFTTRQSLWAGYSPDEIQRLRRGRAAPWRNIRRGVYVVRAWYDGLTVGEQHRIRAFGLSLVLGDPYALSHQTAALELGLAMLDADLSLLHVTRGDLDGSRTEADVTHHAAELLPSELTLVGGLPITPAARTAVDLARLLERLECAVAACDSALRAGVTSDELVAMHVRCRNWRGARRASRAVAMADGRADNPGESWSRVVLTQRGHPPSALQQPFHDRAGLIGYADFFWEDTGTVGEFDGRLKYQVPVGADPEAAGNVVWAEKVREDRLRALGLTVVRWGFTDLLRPEPFLERVARARSRQSWVGYRPGA